MKKNNSFLMIGLTVLILCSCKSKVSEKDAEGYSDKTTTEQKIKIQSDLDNRINQFQNYIDSIKQLIEKVQTVVKSENLVSMSLFDVIYQVNSQVQNQMPRFKDEKIFITGDIELTTKLLSEECRVFDFTVAAESVEPLDELKYSMKSCTSKDDYLDVITAKFEKDNLKISFNESNLKQIIPIESIKNQISECQFSSNSTQPTICKDIMFAQSNHLVWYVDIVSQGNTEISVRALSKNSSTLIYDGKIKISANGTMQDVNIKGPLATEEN